MKYWKTKMKLFFAVAVAFGLAACNQEGPGPVSANASLQELPPIYEPLVDMNRVKESKYKLDLTYCRNLAAPQERTARAAAQQAEVGAVISLAGDVLGVARGANTQQAHALGGALQKVGNSTTDRGATTADVALNDYTIVVNTCLRHRGYILLR